MQLSEKDLPLLLYQFSSKFRDELRARAGLLRAREFLMNDAYSFHKNKSDFDELYQRMKQTYHRIFQRLNLSSVEVAADNGDMGGDYSHEFIVEHELGESKFLVSASGSYAAHQDIATFQRDEKNSDEPLKEIKEQSALRGPSIEAGCTLYDIPAWRQIKTLVYVTPEQESILVSLRGDLEVQEVKLCKVVGVKSLRLATESEVLALGSSVGFVSPLKLKLRKIGDTSLTTVRNFYTGADALHRDTLNVNYGRDFTVDVLADIAAAPANARSEAGELLELRRGIEVGNTFQLGTFYSEKMAQASFASALGSPQPYYMGCYGIGIGRTLATIAECWSDEKGLCWPQSVTPYAVHLLSIGKEAEVKSESEKLYLALQERGISVLFDDRELSAGIKFADAELLGIPQRIVVSSRSLQAGGVEVRKDFLALTGTEKGRSHSTTILSTEAVCSPFLSL